MSRVDELIRELCPDGVEFRALGDAGRFVRGNGMQKSDLIEGGFPAIHYGQIHTYYGTWATETKSYVNPEFGARLRQAAPGDLVIATTSEDDTAVGKATAWIGAGPAAVSGDAFIYKHSFDPKYVAYFFQAEQFHQQKQRFISGTKVRRVSSDSLAKIRIPVPPLAVQREIVRILDTFTELEAGLEAELEARRRQYAYYLDALVSVDESVPLTALAEVATVRVGQPPPSEQLADVRIYPFVNAGTSASGWVSDANTAGDTISIPSRGQGGVGIVGYQRDQFWCGPLCYRIASRIEALHDREWMRGRKPPASRSDLSR